MSAVEEPIINVGLDDGYAAVKVAWYDQSGEIRTLSIPSRARKGSYGIGALDGGGMIGGYETEGEYFTVAPGIEGATTRFPDYNLSSLSRVLSSHALIEAGFAGKSVRIGSGLPLERYFTDGKNMKKKDDDRIARKIESFAKPVRRLDGGETARIGSHKVFAQGLTAVVDWLVCGQTIRTQKARIGVVDIGGQTTDISVILPGFQTDHDHLATRDIGVLDVHKILKRRIMSAHKVDDVESDDLDRALSTGRTGIWGEEVSVQEERLSAIREVESEIENEILAVFEKKISSLEAILFVGGGSLVFRNLRERFPNAILPDRPEFANARGLLKALSLSGGKG